MKADDLKRKKEEAGMTTATLSKLSGVPVGTINKILNGETKSPRYDTLSALEQALDSVRKPSKEVRESGDPYGVEESDVHTTTDSWKLRCNMQADADSLKFPYDVGAERMDGEMICPEKPTTGHQVLVSQLILQFGRFIEETGKNDLVFPSPFRVYPDSNEKTVLQPDISVVCHRERLGRDGLMGAPDLVMEITSSVTRKRDLGRKMCRYLEAGVREYWVLDSKTRNVLVYCFEQDELPAVYSFKEEIPVSIYEGRLRICMRKAAAVLDELGE